MGKRGEVEKPGTCLGVWTALRWLESGVSGQGQQEVGLEVSWGGTVEYLNVNTRYLGLRVPGACSIFILIYPYNQKSSSFQ